MSIQDVQVAFGELSMEVFSDKKKLSGMFNASKLEQALKDIVAKHDEAGSEAIMEDRRSDACKTCASRSLSTSTLSHLIPVLSVQAPETRICRFAHTSLPQNRM